MNGEHPNTREAPTTERQLNAGQSETIRVLRSEIIRRDNENDLLRQALHAFSGYFTSGNSIPVERATILGNSEAVAFMKAALPDHAWTGEGAKDSDAAVVES